MLILEAMKMENEILAPKDGKIASVNVSKGKSVNAGDVTPYSQLIYYYLVLSFKRRGKNN